METPHLPRAIFGHDFESVYEPAEDTFLLLDALEIDLDHLREITSVCFECGSGSGTIITALAKALNHGNNCRLSSTRATHNTRPRLFFATDINSHACLTTRKCAQYHGQNGVQVLRSNLAEALVDRLENLVDLLVFNPPYVPTDEEEMVSQSKQLQLAWAGGVGGRTLIDTFLKSYVPRMLSKPLGVAYMVALDKNNIDELVNCLVNDHRIEAKVVLKRQAGVELLHVIRYNWIP